MRTNRFLKSTTAVAVALAGVATAAVPADAAPVGTTVDVDAYAETTGYNVTSYCALSAGYTTDPRYITFVVTANAFAGGPSPAVATSVQCTVYDALDKSRTYGGASGTMVGATAVAVGTATVPVGRVPAACVTGSAMYFDGHYTSSTKPCP